MINNIHPCTPEKKRGGVHGGGQGKGKGVEEGRGVHTHVIKAHKLLNERKKHTYTKAADLHWFF